jgi:RNA polymerase sigma-70 factor (ECF subfamily)
VTDQPAEQVDGLALARRMAAGDTGAFAAFYDRYADLVFAQIRRLLPQPAEGEDVLQEVFWQAWREAASYDPRRGTPEAWLLNRARSRAIDRLRAIRRRSETFVQPKDETMSQAPDRATPNPGRLAEDRTLVETALAILPAAQRQAIELAFFGGLTQTEIAQRLGEPLGTIKTRTRAGLERLRGYFRSSEGARR